MNTLNIMYWLCFKFTILFNLIGYTNTQNLVPVLKPVPKFSIDTIKQADNIILFDNVPLNTVILRVVATTYQSASPIFYSIIDPLSYFKVDPLTGAITLFKQIDKLQTYQFTIVAKDSAPFPDQQSSFLTANVVVISSLNNPPEFNNKQPYYVSVLDIIAPNSIIYDNIIIKDYYSGQNGILNLFCDTSSPDNPDAKISCEYFRPEAKMIELGLYRCSIRLIKKLDYNIKRNYILTITAQIGTQKILGSSSNLIIEVSNPSRYNPRFVDSPYNLYLKTDTQLYSSVLKLTVANVNISSPDLSFVLYDPKNYFSILNDTYFNCQIDYCNQFVLLKSPIDQITEYSMSVLFKQKTFDTIQTANAQINVIIQRPKVSQSPPSFLNLPYQFIVSENLKPNGLARNVSITVLEAEKLSVYNSGFTLELLNSDFSYANDVFEIAPSYGIGLLVSTLRLKQNAILDYEKGKRRYDYIVKATSRSSNLFSYANVTLFIQDYNEFSPLFEKPYYSVVLNKPEEYKMGDIIMNIRASDADGDGIGNDLVYRVIGPNKDRFYIDINGQVRLFKNFNLVQDENTFYNVTILVTDSGGLSGFTSLMVYLNITSDIALKHSQFQCSYTGFRSDLDQTDLMTLKPKLFVLANSIYPLRYVLVETIPAVSDITIDRNTGEIVINKPINPSIISSYDRITLNVQIFQLKKINNTNDLFEIYLSSVLCPATIYLKPVDANTNLMQRQPYFLQKYSTIVYREYVFKSVALIKVQAISMNPNNMLPISYSIVNDSSQLFTVDSTQGFIYPRIDHGLEPKIYSLLVQATDLTDKTFSTTTVTISVMSKLENELLCDTEYLVLKVDSNELSSSSLPYIFGQLKCYSISFFNDTPIFYEISRSIATYDCNGLKINYTPNIGIDYKSGKLASFEKFVNKQFCDASFTITARKDYASIQVPFRLILIHPVINKPPVFMSPLSQISYSNIYLHIGSYLTTVVAFDPTFNLLIENYAIRSQRANQMVIQPVLKIDSKTGIITLLTPLLEKNIEVDILATTLGGLSSNLTLNFDFSSYFQNIPSNIYFDPNLRNYATINKNQLSSIPVYKAVVKCSLFNQPSIQTQCGQSNFTLLYPKEYSTTASFIVDSSTGNVYLSSSSMLDPSIQSKYLIIINAINQNTILVDRYVRFAQKAFTLFIESNEQSSPVFEKSSYNIQILDTTPIGRPILTMRYRSTNTQNSLVEYKIEEASSSQLEKYFYLQQSSALETIYLYMLTSPLPVDKPEMNFVIRLRNRLNNNLTYEFYDKSFAFVNIRILATANRGMSSFFNFIIPSGANYIVVLNASTINTTVAYQLQTTNQNQNMRPIISYKILNQDPNVFFIDKNLIRLAYPFSDQIDKKRLSYLLFIEAKDLNNPALGSTYTTIDLRLNNILGAIPYFNREPNSPPINIQVNENFPLNMPFFNLTSLIYAPAFCSNLYFYVFNNMPPYKLSKTFYVNPITKSLELRNPLNQTIKNLYNLFVYISNTPLSNNQFRYPTPNNTALLFININVVGPTESSQLQFIDATSYMLIEELMPLGYLIGYAKVNSSFNSVNYSITACDYHSKTVIYKDTTFCDLFRIESDTGFIFTDASNYAPFRTNYFLLKVKASDPNDSSKFANIELKAFVVNYQEKSRFIFYQPPSEQLIDNLNYLKRQLNFELNLKKCGVYYLEYFNYGISNITKSSQDFEACFYIVKIKENAVSTHEETTKLLNTEKIKFLLDSYSIADVNRCNISEYNKTSIKTYYDKYGEWLFTSYSIGLISLGFLTILFTLLAICLLALCWASHMRQATLAPSMELENVDNCSNNLLIED